MGLHKHTILSLMLTAGKKGREVLSSKVRDIRPRFVQLDEMWGFVHMRAPNLDEGDPEECKIKIRTCVIVAGLPRLLLRALCSARIRRFPFAPSANCR
jgi:hypothetical protein